MIGFIAPNGEFIECASWEHLNKAKELCKEQFNKDFNVRQASEDYLLSIGYLILRARDAYMALRSKEGIPIMLTNKQLHWLEINSDKFNEGQKKDLNRILYDQDSSNKIRRF